MNRLLIFIRRMLYTIIMFAMMIVGAVYIFLNTQTGIHWMKSFAEKQFSSLFNGQLVIERAEFKIPFTLSLHGVKVYIENDTVESVSIKEFSFSVVGLLFHNQMEDGLIEQVHIGHVILVSPNATIIQDKEGKLNLSRLLKPDSSAQSESSNPLDFLADEITIQNGDVLWWNQGALPMESNVIASIDSLRKQDIVPVNFDSLHVTKLNLRLKGETKDELITGTIQELSFSIPEADFSIEKTNVFFSLTPQRAELTGLELKTSRSSIKATADLHHYNVFAPYSEELFKKAKFNLNLDIETLSTDDIKRLFPEAYFLGSVFKAKLSANGTTDSFTINEFELGAEKTNIGIKGTIKNAFNLELSELSLSLYDTYLTLADPKKIIPSVDMQDLSHAGRINFSGDFKGRINRFRSQLGFESEFGSGDTDIEIFLPKNQPPEYAGELSLRHINVGKALKDSTHSSDLNLTAKLQGKGNSKKTLDAVFVAAITRSRYSSFRGLDALLNVKFVDQKFSGDISASMGKQSAEFSGSLDLNTDTPVYSGEGRLNHFDISTFTKNDSLNSNLSLSYTIEGSGATLGDINIDFDLIIDSSTIGQLPIPAGTEAKATLIQNKFDSSATFSFTSNLMDMEVEGRYSLAQLVNLIELESAVVGREIYENNIFRTLSQEEKLQQVRTIVNTLEKKVKKQKNDSSSVVVKKVVLPTLNVNFRIALKSLAAVSFIRRTGYFNAKAELRGKISSSPTQCSLSAILKIDSTTYGDLFFAEKLNATFAFTDDILDNSHTLRTKFNTSAFRLRLLTQRFLDSKFELRYDRQALQLEARTSYVNSKARVELDMLAGLFEKEYIIDIENFKYVTNDFTWEANQNSEFQISNTLARFNNVAFRNKDQELSLRGYLEYTGNGNLNVALQNFNLADLRKVVLPEFSDVPFGGKVNLTLAVTGNLQSPNIDFDLGIRDLIFSTIKGGNITVEADYVKKWMTLKLVANLDTMPKSKVFGKGQPFNQIVGSGKFPINLESDGLPLGLINTEDASFDLSSNSLSAKALETFVPLERTSGFIKLLATLRGRFPKPDIRLKLDIDDIKTTPITTQVEYSINGSIEATQNNARWTSLTIKDKFGGVGESSGLINMNNFAVDFLDIGINFNQLSLMRKPEGRDGLPFGNLIASSNNLRYFGSLEAPKLTGRLIINEGDLSSFAKNANNATQFAEASRFITMRPKEDTTLSLEERERLKKERLLKEEFSMEENRERIQAYIITPYDLMTMDIRVTTQRRIQYTIIFNKYLGEQMKVGIEDVDIRVRKRGINLYGFGSATIAGGSYTAFTKNFEVKSGGRISWNEEDILNANIKVNAETKTRAENPSPDRAGIQSEVILVVQITGTALNPNMAMGYRFEDRDFKMPNTDLVGTEDPNAVLNFALLLTAGQWYAPPVELGGNAASIGTGTIASAGLNAGAGLLSSQLSRVAGTIAGVQSVNIGLARDAGGGFSGVDLAVAYAVPGTDGKLIVVGAGSIANNDSAAARGGNANSQKLEYRVSDKVVLEAFRVFGQNNFTIFNQEMQELWGFGIGYRDNFHTWQEFSERVFRRKKKTIESVPEKKNNPKEPQPLESENVKLKNESNDSVINE